METEGLRVWGLVFGIVRTIAAANALDYEQAQDLGLF
jgi:hypothetical protein